MDHSRLLPGGPCSSEGSTVATNVLSPRIIDNQNPRVPPLWENSLTNLLGHDSTSDPGIALRQWVHFQGVENILDLLSWEEDELKAIPAQQVFTLDDYGQGSYLRTNQVKQICGLITSMKHVFRVIQNPESLYCPLGVIPKLIKIGIKGRSLIRVIGPWRLSAFWMTLHPLDPMSYFHGQPT